MNAARLFPFRLMSGLSARGGLPESSAGSRRWPDTQPMCMRSEVFAEDLPETRCDRPVPLDRPSDTARGALRSAPAALLAAIALSALLGAWVLGLGA
jgi:hypothetical protein